MYVRFVKYIVLLLCLFVTTITIAQNTSKLTAYLTYSSFYVPGKTPYIETYLSVIGNSAKFVKNSSGNYQGIINVSIAFTQNGEIKNAKKYTLNSPEAIDTAKGYPNFIDQQRYSLVNGEYIMEVSIADQNNISEKPFSTQIPIKINFTEELVNISDIELLESYTKSTTPNILTKSGYDLVPYVSTFYPDNSTKLKFYAEIYNAKKVLGLNEKMVVSYYIESYEKGVKLSDYSMFAKQTTNDVNILLSEFDISKLPSGNYNLLVEVRDKENKIQALQKLFFQRQNTQGKFSYDDLKSINVQNTFVTSYTNVDTLLDYIRCIRPISSVSEIKYAQNQIKERNVEVMQQFFYNFWHVRDEKNPQLAWLEYYKEVMKVNKEYGTHALKGYDTDRGRVYLQYGPPDQLTKIDREPSSYPYEIWEYYRLYDKSLSVTFPENKQSNKKFIFYNPDLVTNKYTLIHSNAQGETYNYQWQLLLRKRDLPVYNYDMQQTPSTYGNNADEYYRNPR